MELVFVRFLPKSALEALVKIKRKTKKIFTFTKTTEHDSISSERGFQRRCLINVSACISYDTESVK